MKLSKKKADRNELYGFYIKFFGKTQKIFTFEMFLKSKIKIIYKDLNWKIEVI